MMPVERPCSHTSAPGYEGWQHDRRWKILRRFKWIWMCDECGKAWRTSGHKTPIPE